MRNGKREIWPNRILTAAFVLCSLCAFSQKKDNPSLESEFPSFKVDDECRSKSVRTPKPTVLSISRKKLADVKTLKDLVKEIPATCEIKCAFFSVKKADNKDFAFMNIGNEIVYADKFMAGVYILVDNIVSSCPGLHKANYKIMIEP